MLRDTITDSLAFLFRSDGASSERPRLLSAPLGFSDLPSTRETATHVTQDTPIVENDVLPLLPSTRDSDSPVSDI